ncbi:MAG: O-antigen polymerase [Enterococcus thailandicus]|nr:O-antigen polymerase [Enterococcus thailandicus]
MSIYFIFSKTDSAFSLNKMFHLFNLFFLGIAPYLQFNEKISFFGARLLEEYEYFFMNILIIVIIISYQFLYELFLKIKLSEKNTSFTRKFEINPNLSSFQICLLILLSLFSFLMVYKANNSNLLSMLVRGGALKEYATQSQSASLIIFRVFQPMSMMILLYYILTKSKNITVYVVLGLLALITCFPLAMPRFAAAAIYIPFIFTTMPILRKKNIFSLVFILGFLVVFPFLNNFRYFNENNTLSLGFDFSMFTEGHFDSYQNFALIVTEDIVTWGRQLLGVLLFWLPRSIWPSKPIGSGAFIAEIEGFHFDNVSCNYFAEGYVNWGLPGILLFIMILAYVTSRLDKYYWKSLVIEKNNYFQVIYYVLIGMFFFILRGDLMSSFAFTIGFIISIWIVNKIGGLNIKWKSIH